MGQCALEADVRFCEPVQNEQPDEDSCLHPNSADFVEELGRCVPVENQAEHGGDRKDKRQAAPPLMGIPIPRKANPRGD